MWFSWRKVKKGVYLEVIEVSGRIILNCLFKLGWQEVKSKDLSQDGHKFCAFVVMVMNTWFREG
jgi:hypothetical protein